ncbi:MAG TPA: Hsp20/alpha crystallin family protein [Humisphaera sp.]
MPLENATEGSFGNLARAASKMLDQMNKGFFVYSPETWTPNVNLYEAACCYYVCVDLAGVDKEKIDIEVADQRLVVEGRRAVPAPEVPDAAAPSDGDETAGAGDAPDPAKRVRLHLMEIDHGAFRRLVELPADADREGINATYRNGLLWIEIPKK